MVWRNYGLHLLICLEIGFFIPISISFALYIYVGTLTIHLNLHLSGKLEDSLACQPHLPFQAQAAFHTLCSGDALSSLKTGVVAMCPWKRHTGLSLVHCSQGAEFNTIWTCCWTSSGQIMALLHTLHTHNHWDCSSTYMHRRRQRPPPAPYYIRRGT